MRNRWLFQHCWWNQQWRIVVATNGKYDARSQSTCYINKGFKITATWKDVDLHPVDHYLLDEDVVKLAYRSWEAEILDGSFFIIEGLLDQWIDLSIRPKSEAVELFCTVVMEEFKPNIDQEGIHEHSLTSGMEWNLFWLLLLHGTFYL